MQEVRSRVCILSQAFVILDVSRLQFGASHDSAVVCAKVMVSVFGSKKIQ